MIAEPVLHQSIAVDVEEVEKYCFTILPVRIHSRDDIADAATLALVRDWGNLMQDGREKISHCSLCYKGNWCSFIFPESIPERLGLLTYLTDIGLIHDDACEEMTTEQAHQEHLDLDAALNTSDERTLSEGSKSMKTKNLVSQVLLECMKLDHKQSMGMLEAYRKKWLSVMDRPEADASNLETLVDFFEHRSLNGGMGAYWSMLAFSLGITLTAQEEALTSGILESAERALLLTNDYYSWDREFEQSAFDNGNSVTFNAVNFIMKEDDLSEKSALAKVKDMIVAYESEFLDRKSQLYGNNAKLSLSVRSWVESVGLAVAGNHYWSATCPRHNDWKSAPKQPSPDHISIGDLVELSKFSKVSRADRSSEAELGQNGFAHPAYKSAKQSSIVTPENGRNHVENDKSEESGLTFNGISKGPLSNGSSHLELPRTKRHSNDMNGNDNLDLSNKKKRATHLNGNGQVKNANNKVSSEERRDTPLMQPCDYIRGMPSKGFRSSLLECLNNWMAVPPQSLEIITEIIDLLHSSSLILDDIQDSSSARRGKPATHVIFGTPQAINSATFLYLKAIQAARSLPNSAVAIDIVSQELEQLFVGQAWDLYWSYNLVVPSEEAYLRMIDQKTAGLFRMLVRLMVACSTTAAAEQATMTNLNAFASKIGRFFQIRDDYMNINSSTYAQQKGFCEDFNEGKMSYLVIHCASQSAACRDQILGIFRQHTISRAQTSSTAAEGSIMAMECKQHILACMKETHTLESTLDLLIQLEEEIEEEIEEIEDAIGVKNWTLHLLLKTLTVKS